MYIEYMKEILEVLDCDVCGGARLEDYGKCTCDEKEIRKLKKEVKDLEQLFYAGVVGSYNSLPKRLKKKYDDRAELM